MNRTKSSVALALGVAAFAIWNLTPARGQQGTPASGEWRVNGGDTGSTRYSPLDQIDATNVKNLQVVWRWKAQNMGPAPQAAWEVTPLMAGGKLFFTAGTGRTVVAADAATGETLWTYRGDDTAERGAVRANNRGVSYWSDGRGDDRILFITPGYQLVALNAKTGAPIANFGKDSHVDLWLGLDRPVVQNGTIGATSPPIIIRDVAVVGASLKVGVALPTRLNTPGYIRGYDVRTGKLLWTFHTVPQPGEFGADTWGKDDRGKDSNTFTGNTGAWGPLTGDEELGYVYIPVEAPSGDTYGGQRPGANLFSDSVVCLDAKTGKRVWHYQLIHHEMWDYDIPAAPILLDLTVNGKKIKALAQVNKSAFTFVFDRTNGQPVWPIEERPAPKGQRSRRMVFAHAALSHQARGVRSPGRDRSRSGRLHARDQGRGFEDRVAICSGADLHAADRQGHRRQAGDDSASGRGRRSQLDGRRGRSRNRDAVHPFDHQPVHFDAGSGRRSLGDALHRRRRRREHQRRGQPAADQRSVRPHHGVQSQYRRPGLDDSQRQARRQHREQSGAQGRRASTPATGAAGSARRS